MNTLGDKHRRRLRFGWSRQRPEASEHQTKYKKVKFECAGKNVAPPKSRKNPPVRGWLSMADYTGRKK